MRILITGGAGFIGSHLAESLLFEGHQIAVLDDLSSGSRDNISHLLSNPAFFFYSNSIFNIELLSCLMKDCDLVYHLAAAVGVKQIIDAPVETIHTNVSVADTVLRIAAAHSRRIVLASTSEVYGKSAKLPFREGDDLVLGSTDHSRWSYACSKAIDEFMALAWHRQSGLPVTIVRLFNTVGPRQSERYGMVLPTFVRQALLGLAITVYGNGEQSRCFSHVSDIVRGLVAIAHHDKTIGEIYNLGSTSEINMNQLAARVLASTGSSSIITHIPYEQAYTRDFEDVHHRLPDISKANLAFNFQTNCNLDQILDDVVADMRARIGQYSASTATTTPQ
jgi:UDP-glucose 4-epimerase